MAIMKIPFFRTSAIALWSVLSTCSITQGSDIRMGRYEYNFGNTVVTTKDREVFVICKSCAASQRLTLKPKMPALAIRMAAIATGAENTEMGETSSVRNPVIDPKVGAGGSCHQPIANMCLMPVYFRFDHSDLSDFEKDQLDRLISGIKDNPAKEFLKVRITGYTCDLGSRAYNNRLSLQRAKSVASYLEDKGFTILEVIGEGGNKPISELRRLNRRVEIHIVR